MQEIGAVPGVALNSEKWVLNDIYSDPQRNAVRCANRSSIKQQNALNGSGYRYIYPSIPTAKSLWLVACALAVMYEMDCGMQEEGIAEEALAAAQNKARNGLLDFSRAVAEDLSIRFTRNARDWMASRWKGVV